MPWQEVARIGSETKPTFLATRGATVVLAATNRLTQPATLRLHGHHARLLDRLQFREWLQLYTDECLYWVPGTPNGGDPRREIAVMFDDRRRLEDRVFRLTTGFAWSQAPSSRTVRMISNVEVFASENPDQRLVRSNFLIHEFWDDETRALPGWAGHRFRRIDGAWRISAKQVNLLECDQCIRNPSIIL